MGIPQEFAHTRLYTDIDFTFYVDTNYVNLRVFESWIDYISGGSEGDQVSELNENYYRRMRYPDTYKVQTMFISKFEKDFNSQIDYQFINAFPKLITAIPVAYGAADLLKVTVQFSYDRYIVNPRGSIKKANTSEFSDIPRVANEKNPNDSNFITSGLSQELLDTIAQYDGDRGLNLNGGNIDNFRAGIENNSTASPQAQIRQRNPGSNAQTTAPTVDPRSNEAALSRQEAAKLKAQQEREAEAAALKAEIADRIRRTGTDF